MRSNYPRPFLAEEIRSTEGNPDWRDDLLTEVGASLGQWKSWATQVGTGKNEMQIRFVNPISAQFSFMDLNTRYVQFRILKPQTKQDSTMVVRFGPDTAAVMTLVKVPSESGNFKWYLLARRKYQFAAKDLFIEFSRGWIKDSSERPGMYLFHRDFPGLEGNPLVASITEHKIGSPYWENNAQFANKVSHYLVVVEMKAEIGKDELQKLLIEAKLYQEYPVEKLEDLDAKDLTSYPMVFELEDAAKHLNAHLKGIGDKLIFFGENFSIVCWSMFLSLWGKQFPHLLPDPEDPI